MSAGCCSSTPKTPVVDKPYRKILWFSLVANLAMFFVEIVAGAMGNSLALTADAVDFLSDGSNYAITLVVLSMSLQMRSSAALFKGGCMGAVGVYVLFVSVSHIVNGTVPHAQVMGVIGFMALITNVVVALLLFRHRSGDANRQSIWICSRNDAIGNIAVMLAGAGVWVSDTGWPDIAVGLGIAGLGLWGAAQIISRSVTELRTSQAQA
jgi:cation diffusion facilitator family transporter